MRKSVLFFFKGVGQLNEKLTPRLRFVLQSYFKTMMSISGGHLRVDEYFWQLWAQPSCLQDAWFPVGSGLSGGPGLGTWAADELHRQDARVCADVSSAVPIKERKL